MDLTPGTRPNTRQRRPTQRIWPPNTIAALTVATMFAALLHLIEVIDTSVYSGGLDLHGIVPRDVSGLDGVLFAPLLHADWAHLTSNTVPVIVLGFLAMAGGFGQWLAVTATIWLVGGIGVWFTAEPGTITIGASVLIFGWLTFLLARGWFNRSAMQILLGVALFLVWGGMLLGVLPGTPGVSWQGHLFGAVGGVLAAWLVARSQRGNSPAPRPATQQF